MKVLLLVQVNLVAHFDRLYESIAEICDCDIHRLTTQDQRNLKRYFRDNIKADEYDRILMFIRFKWVSRQVRFLRTLPNLVYMEHDACQNYFPGKYCGKFSAHYKLLPWVRIISSGKQVSSKLQDEGFDAVFIPKGYDDIHLKNKSCNRDIEIAFIGSVSSNAYTGRRLLLEDIARTEPLVITRTQSLDEYVEILNRIKFFLSADVGLGEYMMKNFEAMACGCLLLAYDQGEMENEALQFKDMHNVVLYSSVETLREKLAVLRADPALCQSIAKRGQQLAESEFALKYIADKIITEISKPLREPAVKKSWFQYLTARVMGRV